MIFWRPRTTRTPKDHFADTVKLNGGDVAEALRFTLLGLDEKARIQFAKDLFAAAPPEAQIAGLRDGAGQDFLTEALATAEENDRRIMLAKSLAIAARQTLAIDTPLIPTGTRVQAELHSYPWQTGMPKDPAQLTMPMSLMHCEITLELTALDKGRFKTRHEIRRQDQAAAIQELEAVKLGTITPYGAFSGTLHYGEPVIALDVHGSHDTYPKIIAPDSRSDRPSRQLALGSITLNGVSAFTTPPQEKS